MFVLFKWDDNSNDWEECANKEEAECFMQDMAVHGCTGFIMLE